MDNIQKVDYLGESGIWTNGIKSGKAPVKDKGWLYGSSRSAMIKQFIKWSPERSEILKWHPVFFATTL